MIELSWMSREGHHVPVAILAENLGISKIYLEQIFSLLKRSGLVASVKGAQGGYHLAKPASEISVYEILKALEQILFEPTESSVDERAFLCARKKKGPTDRKRIKNRRPRLTS